MSLQAKLVGEALLTDLTLEGFVPDMAVQMPLDLVQIVRTLVAERTDVLGVLLDAAGFDDAWHADLRVVQDARDGKRDHLIAVDAIENGGARWRRRIAALLKNYLEEI